MVICNLKEFAVLAKFSPGTCNNVHPAKEPGKLIVKCSGFNSRRLIKLLRKVQLSTLSEADKRNCRQFISPEYWSRYGL